MAEKCGGGSKSSPSQEHHPDRAVVMVRATCDVDSEDASPVAVAVAADRPVGGFGHVEQVLLAPPAEVHRALALVHSRQPLVYPHPEALLGVLDAGERHRMAADPRVSIAAVDSSVVQLAMGAHVTVADRRVVLLLRQHVAAAQRGLTAAVDLTANIMLRVFGTPQQEARHDVCGPGQWGGGGGGGERGERGEDDRSG